MTRQCSNCFLAAAILFAAQFFARADATNATNGAVVKSAILENEVAYFRVGEVNTNFADEIGAAQTALATNKIVGTVLDLRFANGDDLGAARAAADFFGAKKLPLAILMNGETRGAALTLAADLRSARAGLIFGGTTADLQPDISVSVSADDEKKFLDNPYATPGATTGETDAGSNQFLPFIDHTSEADLVREKIKDGEQDENAAPSQSSEPPKPFIRDPALARAVDLIQGLAVARQSHL